MGRNIHVRIVKRDRDTDKWKQIKLYYKEKRKIKLVNVYPFRSDELFDIIDGSEDEKYNAYPISLINLPDNLQKEIERCQNTLGYYKFKEISLADLKLYLYKSPKVRDWDYEDDDPKAWKDNPVKYFIERIEQYIDFADPYWDLETSLSDIKILYWFDC